MKRLLIAPLALCTSALLSTSLTAQVPAAGFLLADQQAQTATTTGSAQGQAVTAAGPAQSGQGQGTGRGTGNFAPASARDIQAFAVTLIVADMQPGGTQDDVPAAARKALADVRDFLPYKSYRLLDAQWIRGQNSAETRIKGVDQQEYSLRLQASPLLPQSGKTNIRFRLFDAAAPQRTTDSAAAARAMLKRQQLEEQRKDVQAKVEIGLEKPATLRAVEGELEVARLEVEQIKKVGEREVASVMDANFSMALDETVVVGTSRIKGDKALIALLTAIGTKPSGGR